MPQMVDKSQLFFEFCEMIKNKHNRRYASFFMMSKNEKEQDLMRHLRCDTTLVSNQFTIDGKYIFYIFVKNT